MNETLQMTQPTPEMSEQLERVVDGLVNHTGGTIHRHDLREIVYDCYGQLAANAKVTTFLPVLTQRFALTQIRAMGIVSGDVTKEQPEVLIMDEHNAVRSQTAAALMRFYAPGRFHVISAGLHPSGYVSTEVLETLGDLGLGLTDYPKPLTPQMVEVADHVISIGAVTPEIPVPGTALVWDIADPEATDQATMKEIFSQIDRHVREFLGSVDPDHVLHSPVIAAQD